MAHQERITDIPASSVDMIRQRMEQRGATVVVTPQGNGMFTVEGTYPDTDLATAVPELMAAAAVKPSGAEEALPSALTDSQSQAAKAIVNIFETGAVLGEYSQVTLIPGDTGHLTYGRSQTTLGSGLLHDLLSLYAGNAGARFGTRLRHYLPRTKARDIGLDRDVVFCNLLRAAADDPVMRETQDGFFDSRFWRPAVAEAKRLQLTLPLSVAVVYDSRVHGSWDRLRDQTMDRDGTVEALGERAWIAAYLTRRRHWLASHERQDLRPTVYRMDAFQRLVDQDRWGLALPLVVRGREVSVLSLAAAPPGCYEGPAPGTRQLALSAPLARGLDVRLLQLALSDSGLDVAADGIFGQASSDVLREFQTRSGQPATGVADAAQVATLARAAIVE
jgi:chitosanase